MCEDQYLPNEFNYIQYEASSGGLSCPESDARHSYYSDNGTGIPDTRFDGSWMALVGAPESYATGEYFGELIDQRRLTQAPLAVIVSDFSFVEPGAFVQVKVKMFDDIASPAGYFVRVAIVEDDLTYGSSTYQNVLRRMLPDANGTALTVSQNGEEQVLNLDLAMGAGWIADNLQVIAFVQRDSDKLVINSGNSFVGEYGAAIGVTGPQQVIADDSQVVFGTTNIINVGLNPDVFDVTLDTSQLPDGWDAHMVYDGADYQSFSVPLDSFGSDSFYVVMNTGTVGSGRVTVDIFSQGGGEIIQSLAFAALPPGTDLLVVADDQVGNAATYYGPAIEAAGKTYAIWDQGISPVAGDDLIAYEAVIWETGGNGTVMADEDRVAIDAYLASDQNLILAGEDVLESLNLQGESLWYQLRLRINYASGNSGNLVIDGQPGTVGDGLAFTLTGGDPDQLVLIGSQDQYVTEAFRFGNGEPAGVQVEYSDYKVLYLPFGLESVPADMDRAAIIDGALDWMGLLDPLATDDVPLAGARLLQNAPNPFNPATKISLVMDRTDHAKLEIFNARGQLVRVLVDGTLVAGEHAVVWNGDTDGGQQAASGTYFYRLTTGDDQVTKKMSLVK